MHYGRKCGSLSCGCWMKEGDCINASGSSPQSQFSVNSLENRYKELREITRQLDERLKRLEPAPKEPCKCEPIFNPLADQWQHRCHKCNSKIKATGWEMVE